MTVPYKQQTNDIAPNCGPGNGGYGGAVVPVPMTYSSPMYGSEPYGYGTEPYRYTVSLMAQQKHQIRNRMATKLKLI